MTTVFLMLAVFWCFVLGFDLTEAWSAKDDRACRNRALGDAVTALTFMCVFGYLAYHVS